MAFRFEISLQNGERDLALWIRDMMNNNKISPSLVFRDAMLQKKKEWEEQNNENPALLKKRVEDLKQTIAKQSEFIQANSQRQEEWFDFFENYSKKTHVKQIEKVEVEGIKQ